MKNVGYLEAVNSLTVLRDPFFSKSSMATKADDHNDPAVKLVDTAMDRFSELTASNAFAVNVFSFRKLSARLHRSC
jgi:hypothetical protein